MRSFLKLIIRIYQIALSPYLGNRCRFYPSCSEYAKTCLETHSLVKSSLLISRRLSRCHPFCEGGHDPVPL